MKKYAVETVARWILWIQSEEYEVAMNAVTLEANSTPDVMFHVFVINFVTLIFGFLIMKCIGLE